MASMNAYRPDIDGMRAVAVLSVLAYHYGLSAPGGFVGVDVFFVISGYLIGSLLYEQATWGTFSYLAFYARRARRILPALLAVLAVTYAVMLVVATPSDLESYGHTAVATLLSLSNVQLWQSLDYFHPTADLNPLLMTWSLGVEEQFYLVAPLVMLLLPRLALCARPMVLGGLIVGSLGLAVWAVRIQPGAAFYLLPTRAWELAAGVLVGVLEIHRIGLRVRGPAAEALAWAGLLLIALPVMSYGRDTVFPGWTAVPPVLGSALLLSTPQAALNRRVLALPPLRAIGLVSYSLYLWHWPLISMARLVEGREPSLWARIALLALSGLLAAASYRFVETPFRRGASPARVSLKRYAAVLGVALVMVGSAVVMQGFPRRWPGQFVVEARQFDSHHNPCLAVHHDPTPETSRLCYPEGEKLIALVGDSHAAALAAGLRAVAAREGWGLVVLAKASCQFLVGAGPKVARHPELLHDCSSFNRRVMTMLLDDPRVGGVIIAGAWRAGSMRPTHYVALDGPARPSDELFAQGLARAVRTLEEAGKRVVIARDIPFLRLEPRSLLAACASWWRHLWPGQGEPGSCGRVDRANTVSDAPALAVLARVARETGASLVDPRARFCDASGCRIALDGRTYYRDRQHLSPLGSSQAAAAFEVPLENLVSSDPWGRAGATAYGRAAQLPLPESSAVVSRSREEN
ncbi:acyltransferase family protein [Frateuria soli]|uniref:acyltransferase family protein n=1 Tax=Frateuria soli TaxID=1542730 RepID=UPI001E5ECD31|nr:acyltransferase family protein [Frateuria soli]UGB37201.1 acyltransferase [Frateuria soli]